MAIVRRTLDEIRAQGPRVDRDRLSKVRDDQIARSIAADPDVAPDMGDAPLPPQPRALRVAAHMTQEQFAKLLGVPLATLRNWEQERHKPDPGAAALFRLMSKDLDHALKMLES